MRRAEPILSFDMKVDKSQYSYLKNLLAMSKSDDEFSKELHIKCVRNYMDGVREVMLDSGDEDIVNAVTNYMSLYLKDDNTVGIIVYDAVKSDPEAHVEVHKDMINDECFRPYILVEDN